MSELYDVIIAGAGPVGLFLACELGLAGASVLVLESSADPHSPFKAAPLGMRGLNTPSVEALHRRGLLSKLFDLEERMVGIQGKKFGGHFAGMMLDSSKLELSRWKYRLIGPALSPGPSDLERIEAVLAERAESLGVTILRGHGVTHIVRQDDVSVTVTAGEAQNFRGKWLVGCDGGRSVVRKIAGFDFVGTEPTFTGFGALCTIDHPERLQYGFNVTKNGLYIVWKDCLRLMDFDGGSFDRRQEITIEHFQDVLDRLRGETDVKITSMGAASSFTDRCKQATSYRKGRILLAGDAAHIHSPIGAQGLNTGLGDAMNLGWKLASTIRQEARLGADLADLTLLDSYESERHPAGALALEWTYTQVAVLRQGPYGQALQALALDLFKTVDGTNYFIDRFWGLSQHYDLEENAHPLVGLSAPDFELDDGTRLDAKQIEGRGMLVDFENNVTLKSLVADREYEGRVDYVETGTKDRLGLRAFLVRPDGFVAWAVEDDTEPDFDALKGALKRWFAF